MILKLSVIVSTFCSSNLFQCVWFVSEAQKKFTHREKCERERWNYTHSHTRTEWEGERVCVIVSALEAKRKFEKIIQHFFECSKIDKNQKLISHDCQTRKGATSFNSIQHQLPTPPPTIDFEILKRLWKTSFFETLIIFETVTSFRSSSYIDFETSISPDIPLQILLSFTETDADAETSRWTTVPFIFSFHRNLEIFVIFFSFFEAWNRFLDHLCLMTRDEDGSPCLASGKNRLKFAFVLSETISTIRLLNILRDLC